MYVHIIFSTKKISPYFSPKKKKTLMYARTRYPSRTLSVYSYINKQNSLHKKKNKKQKTKQTSFGYTFIRIYGVFNGLEQENVKCFG